jgi:CsoR family transcriptional regulator, copper-sensing transcriptional repressor
MRECVHHDANLMDLKRIEGQIRGIQRMISESKYCVDILNQIHAVLRALSGVEDDIIERHIRHCVVSAIRGKSAKEREDKLSEVLGLRRKFKKL